jgi:hypothetical protein
MKTGSDVLIMGKIKCGAEMGNGDAEKWRRVKLKEGALTRPISHLVVVYKMASQPLPSRKETLS